MKKVVIVMVGGLLLALIVVFFTQKPKGSMSPSNGVIQGVTNSLAKPSPMNELKTHADPSGFNFQYSKSLLLTEKKITDQSTYAWVELTDLQKTGLISVRLESSDLTKIDDWFTAIRKGSIKGEIKNVKVADLDGREFISNNQTTTLALDQGGVLITIATDTLLTDQKQIVSSFIFTQPAQTTTTGTLGGGEEDIVFEGEEVVE